MLKYSTIVLLIIISKPQKYTNDYCMRISTTVEPDVVIFSTCRQIVEVRTSMRVCE